MLNRPGRKEKSMMHSIREHGRNAIFSVAFRTRARVHAEQVHVFRPCGALSATCSEPISSASSCSLRKARGFFHVTMLEAGTQSQKGRQALTVFGTGIGCERAQLRSRNAPGELLRSLRASASISRAASASASTSAVEYGAEQIRVLEGLEAVRLRPGMYIGSTGPKGVHHLVYEIVDNAVDEAQAGHAKRVWIRVYEDGWVEVGDDGRGIPCDTHSQTGKSTLETVLTVLHSGGKFGGEESGYTVSGGLHGVGISVVNALTSTMDVTVRRGDGIEYSQSFSRGMPVSDLKVVDLSKKIRSDSEIVGDSDWKSCTSGTFVKFLPDVKIFGVDNDVKFDTILQRVRELAFLNSGIAFHIEGPSEKLKLSYEGGIKEYVAYQTRKNQRINSIFSFKKVVEDVEIECALVWCTDSYSDQLLGYANNVRTVDGGNHIDGFKMGLTKVMNSLAKKHKFLKEDENNLSGEHIREGLVCVLSVKLPQPEFEGQTKTKLGNTFVRRIVESAVMDEVGYYLESSSNEMKEILTKAIQAKKAAEAAKKARELVRRKSVLRSSTLPGKLADCSSKTPAEREIFLVEGDSAGGSAKQARNRLFQAILPLKGKIINIEKKDEAHILNNAEIQNLILALGLGVKNNDEKFDESKLRYHKIIILTDADVDGAHIRTLLLTFLFRYQRKLFELGHVYMAVPPLYKVTTKKGSVYAYNEEELNEITSTTSKDQALIQRFKGLGEMMPEQLWETSLNPQTRTLMRLTVDDVAETNSTISLLMSPNVPPRKALIEKEGHKYTTAAL